jgi:hypothetical protein
MPLPDALHQPFYCEENVFHLCSHPALSGRRKSAVFVTAPAGGCVMWHQRAARSPSAPLLWDYHVFLLAETPWEVWDLDTWLGVPVPAGEYLKRSFRTPLRPDLEPLFRVVASDEFVRALASDRSHMRRRDGSFERPPPPWPPISAAERGSNLARFVDMRDPFVGEVLSLPELLARVSSG